MATPKVPVPATPKLFDAVLATFNTNLVAQLTWLNYAFGQAERITKITDKRRMIYPEVYAGRNIKEEYRNVMPDEFMGQATAITGFSWIDISNIQMDSNDIRRKGYVNADAGIVFWFNLEKVLNDSTEYRNWDLAIFNIIAAIRASSKGFKGHMLPTGWTKRVEEIYRGYSLPEASNKYLMHPFAGVRINCELRFFEGC